MKRLVLTLNILFYLFVIFGCSHWEGVTRELKVTGFDFTKYSEKGFLITPLKYENDYESIGVIIVTLYPEVKTFGEKVDPTKFSKMISHNRTYYIEDISPYEAINKAYETALDMGANAIIQFEAKDVTKEVEGHEISGYQISGYAIKRNE